MATKGTQLIVVVGPGSHMMMPSKLTLDTAVVTMDNGAINAAEIRLDSSAGPVLVSIPAPDSTAGGRSAVAIPVNYVVDEGRSIYVTGASSILFFS